jgi:KRAB domain-containing zinc finger protein
MSNEIKIPKFKIIELNNINKTHQCSICFKIFNYNFDLINHMIIHKYLIKCCICNKKFTRKYNLIQHIKIHNNESEFECIICLKNFSCNYSLIRHMKNIHNHIFKCNICGEKFNKYLNFKQHIKSHKLNYIYKCFICNINFNYSTNLLKHTKCKMHKLNIL